MAVGKQVGKSSGVSDLTEKDVEFWSLIWWEGVFAFKLVKNRLQDFDPARISQIFLILVSLVSKFCVFRRNPLKISMLAWLWWWKVESFALATSRLWKLYVLERLNSWLFLTTRLLCGKAKSSTMLCWLKPAFTSTTETISTLALPVVNSTVSQCFPSPMPETRTSSEICLKLKPKFSMKFSIYRYIVFVKKITKDFKLGLFAFW